MSKVADWITHRYVKWIVIAFWVVAAAVMGPLAGKLTGAEKNDAKSWLPASAESTQVLEISSAFGSPNTIPAVIVYVRESGMTSSDLEKVAADAKSFAQLDTLGGEVVGPIPSQDGKAAQIIVPLDLGSEGWNKAAEAVTQLRATAESGANGLQVYVTGPAGQAADSSKAFEGIDSTLLYAAAGVVILILLLTYRSPILWLLPLISAGIALTVAQAVIYWVATNTDLTVNAQSAGILTVLVFGAGTDYALLLVARYREELRRHEDRHEAMARALHRAAPAILASGATVTVGMLCLLFAEMKSTSGLGPVAAIGVIVALLVTLTLLPALLVVCGRWVFWPSVPHLGSAEPSEHGVWARLGGRISHAPRRTWIVTSLILLVMGLGVLQLNANGLSSADSFRGEQPSIVGEQALKEHFPAGAGSPVVVVSDAGSADAVSTAFAGVDGIVPGSISKPLEANGYAYMEGTLTSEPDSDEAFATIDRTRDAVHAVPGANAMVGGATALSLDVQRASAHDNRLIIPIILLAVLLILALVLRAILAPVILVATVVLSFVASLGASALVFRHIFGFAGADPSLILFVFVFLVALGIDYNIFLMTRVREESLRFGTRRGALIGLASTGAVITSAGAVLAGTFLVLGTLPLVAFAEIGFAVAFGVLLDTLVVRSILVTALNLDVGRHMWWPSALGRKEDVEEVPEEVPARVGM